MGEDSEGSTQNSSPLTGFGVVALVSLVLVNLRSQHPLRPLQSRFPAPQPSLPPSALRPGQHCLLLLWTSRGKMKLLRSPSGSQWTAQQLKRRRVTTRDHNRMLNDHCRMGPAPSGGRLQVVDRRYLPLAISSKSSRVGDRDDPVTCGMPQRTCAWPNDGRPSPGSKKPVAGTPNANSSRVSRMVSVDSCSGRYKRESRQPQFTARVRTRAKTPKTKRRASA